MTDQELKKLNRAELLKLLLDQSRENEELRRQLADRKIQIENAGSIAEAALQLNGVFQAAQAACDQYTESVKKQSEQQKTTCDRIISETREKCERQERETTEKCERMVAEAKRQSQAYWDQVSQKIQAFTDSCQGLRSVLNLSPKTPEQE